MIDRILVPLDGSPLSDRIVVLLRRVLTGSAAAVTLLQVVPRGSSGEDARAHLERVASPLRAEGVNVAAEVAFGDPTEEILAREPEPPALIVMATHGRSGVQRWVRGSVAERVLRWACRPVLSANPFGLGEELRFRRILVPLDGSERAASVLPVVRDVARLYGATVVLHFSLPDPTPTAECPPFTMSESEGRELLEPFIEQLEGVPAELSMVRGDPALAILEAAERGRCDLVAMTTHGRSGVSRWIFGSVAEHVLRQARCPLLVKRV